MIYAFFSAFGLCVLAAAFCLGATMLGAALDFVFRSPTPRTPPNTPIRPIDVPQPRQEPARPVRKPISKALLAAGRREGWM